MGRLLPLLFLLEIALAVAALISCLSVDEGDIRGLPKIAWVIIILLFPLVGAIAWFLAGRPVTVAPKPNTWRPGSGFPEAERPRQVAPDDNPEFLNSLRRDDERMFKRWEEDLRRREEDLRKREGQQEDERPEG
jgi:hypothetical protein